VLLELPVHLMELAAAVVAGHEILCLGLRTSGGIGIAPTPLGVAALVGAERFQAFASAAHIAIRFRRHAVLGAGAAMIAQALERAAARAVFQSETK